MGPHIGGMFNKCKSMVIFMNFRGFAPQNAWFGLVIWCTWFMLYRVFVVNGILNGINDYSTSLYIICQWYDVVLEHLQCIWTWFEVGLLVSWWLEGSRKRTGVTALRWSLSRLSHGSESGTDCCRTGHEHPGSQPNGTPAHGGARGAATEELP